MHFLLFFHSCKKEPKSVFDIETHGQSLPRTVRNPLRTSQHGNLGCFQPRIKLFAPGPPTRVILDLEPVPTATESAIR